MASQSYNFFVVDLIFDTFPHAKVIWMKRHPHAVMLSLLQNNMVNLPWAHELSEIHEYIRNHERIMETWKELFPGKILEIDYEALVNHPVEVSKQLFEYCELEWSEQCLDFPANSSKRSKTHSNTQIRQKLYTKATNAFAPYANPKGKGINSPPSTFFGLLSGYG